MSNENFKAFVPALIISVLLHVVVLGALVSSRGCSPSAEKSGADDAGQQSVQTDGRANDMPEDYKKPDVSEESKPSAPAKSSKSSKSNQSSKIADAKKESHKTAEAIKTPVKIPEVKPEKIVQDKPANESDDTWVTYKVKPGDSLTRIARSCGCTIHELAKANGISPTANLRLGQTIKIKGNRP